MIKHWKFILGPIAAITAMAASVTPVAADYRTCMEFCTKEHTFSRCNELCAGQAGGAPKAGADCSTDDTKGEALVVFLEKHYGDVTVMAYPSDQGTGLLDVYFHPYEPQEKDCEGVVRVDDECRVTDAEGAPLDSARARQRAFRCALSG